MALAGFFHCWTFGPSKLRNTCAVHNISIGSQTIEDCPTFVQPSEPEKGLEDVRQLTSPESIRGYSDLADATPDGDVQ